MTHFLRVERDEWEQALEVLDAREASMSQGTHAKPPRSQAAGAGRGRPAAASRGSPPRR